LNSNNQWDSLTNIVFMSIKSKFLVGTAAMLVALSVIPVLKAADAAASTLKAMTYNLRYASAEGENAWPSRRPIMAEMLRAKQPDVMGTQEGLVQQLNDLLSDLPGYARIGLGREGGEKGEFSAILYRTNRLEVSDMGNFWLSDTPTVMASTSWGNKLPRMVTWAKFQDRLSNRSFYFLNTHLDHQSQNAREQGNLLIRKTIESWKTDLPVLVSGDFNAAAGNNAAYDVLVKDTFTADTWVVAPVRSELVSTFNSFQGIKKEGVRIDWILIRGPLKALSAEIITHAKDGRFPSDHFPYLTVLEFTQ
jgi:endonuclease/exonuclease/phosphatase family metal-dependent hydrolase